MKAEIIHSNKTSLMPLLILGDEQESLIKEYLNSGTLFAFYQNQTLIGASVVTTKADAVYEIKNLAVSPEWQGMGYGRAILNYLEKYYQNKAKTLIVGTGEGSDNLIFYQKCGYQLAHLIPNFFLENYDHPIFENGIQLKDMRYLSKKIAD
ncbi:MAG: GNAT family N-acetyltransferase [Streptococcaceae bacterium]|jgi:ribosomal protein S18 acetylase RimI-like enzyme|nr:GNAT family N-acetyltransferase [Streptococcaceae bacterium]MCH4176297.1 GNAT family N-acetyltransferase [Streptococcaceae bacterium]